MRGIYSTLALLGAFASTSCAIVASETQVSKADVDESVIPGAYIVEFDGDDDPNTFYQGLGANGIEVDHRMDLKYRLFKGASFNVRDISEPEITASKIVANPRVKSVWPVRRIQFPKPDVTPVGDNAELARRTLSMMSKRQVEGSADDFTPHLMTQVDKLHAKGFTGKGLRIGIVDTGVDYKHPALGGCFGKGCLIEYGYDFNGDNDTSPVPIPDPDPYDNCVGHGTHVTGIIAAQANEHGFLGAAPGVKIGMYKASGCGGSTTNEILIAGFNAAFEDGSDIISCSAGDDSGWTSDPWAMVASRISAAGVPVIVAPGNDGNAGLWYTSTPASGINVTAVGSVENIVLPTLLKAGSFDTGNGTVQKFGLRFGNPSFQENVTLPLWAVSNNTEAQSDACEPLPENTPDLSNHLVLVRVPNASESCDFRTQATNIAAKGGAWILWYSQTNKTLEDIYASVDGIKGVAALTAKLGSHFIKQLNEGHSINVTVKDSQSSGLYIENFDNSLTGGYMSRSSSWGPTWELEIKPQVASPGGDILSTYPLALGGYSVISGTSMATPLVSAIFALLGEVRGTLDPTLLRNLLSATAKPQVWFDGETAHNDILAPVAQQGAGIVQAYDAAFATSILSVNGLAFNDSDHFIAERTFSIENTANEDVTYVLGHAKAATMYTFADGGNVLGTTSFPNPIVNDWAQLKFASDEVVVPAGGKADVTITLAPPSTLNETLLPVYSGYITLNSTRNESLSIPYLGVVGSMHDTPTVQPGYNGGVYLSNSDGHFSIPVAANQTFTINRPGSNSTSNNIIWPVLLGRLTMGAQKLRADLVSLTDTSLPTTKWHGYDTLGLLPGFPQSLVYRSGVRVYFTGQLNDKTIVPEGSYKIVVSAVKSFGDAEKEEEWDVAETVPFVLKYTS
ncbi:peptidase [Whalleya microplaca]|nr:peptidase [Whalleya microplaca]